MNVFITGGSRGIGRATVLKFAEKGWGCAFTYIKNSAEAKETVSLANKINPELKIKSFQLDLKDPKQVEKVVETALSNFENIQAVVNNAAVVRNNAAVMMSDEEWSEVLDTNLSGPFYITRSLLMHFISNKSGRIINISSLAQDGCSGQVNYAASKAGIIGFTKSIAREFASRGITANAVAPGYIQSEMTEKLSDKAREDIFKTIPLGKLGTPKDVAGTCLFLASEKANYITGQTLVIDGGMAI